MEREEEVEGVRDGEEVGRERDTWREIEREREMKI